MNTELYLLNESFKYQQDITREVLEKKIEFLFDNLIIIPLSKNMMIKF
jgi:hypothetical protein